MSKQTSKDKQETPSNISQRDLEADFLLNKHVFRTCAYGVAGFGLGLATTLLFFKHKATMSMFFAGAGAGYGIAGFTNDLSHYRRYKIWSQNQNRQLQRSGDAREGLRDFDAFSLNQFAQSQRSQDRWSQQKDGGQRGENRQDRSQQRDDQRHDQKQDKSSQQKDDHKQHQDQRKHDGSHDKDGDKKHDTKGQQGKQDDKSQHGQQNKQAGQQEKEQPLNKEAQDKQDIANQKKGNQEAQVSKLGHGAGQAQHTTQDKDKKVEEAVYSQSLQGGQPQRGERSPSRSDIPPSQKDQTGGHANQGVNQQQVHRGSPENDKKGMSPGPGSAQKDNKGQAGNQAIEGKVDIKGQNLQTFESNPSVPGKGGLTHELKKDYQENRNRAADPDLDNQRRQIHGLEQDRRGQSVKEGNNIKVREASETRAGVGNYQPGVAEQNLKNQVNAVIE